MLVLLGLVAFRQSYADRILPGIQVGGVEVGGLTRAEARAALVAALGPLEQGDVTVRSGVGYVVIPYAEVGRTVDFDAMVDRAAALGRDSTRFAETVAGLRLLVEPVAMPPIIRFDRARLDGALAAYRDRTPAGHWTPGSSDRVGLLRQAPVNGVPVDTTRVAPAIEAALLDPATPASLASTPTPRAWIPPATSRPTPCGRSRGPTRSRRTSS